MVYINYKESILYKRQDFTMTLSQCLQMLLPVAMPVGHVHFLVVAEHRQQLTFLCQGSSVKALARSAARSPSAGCRSSL